MASFKRIPVFFLLLALTAAPLLAQSKTLKLVDLDIKKTQQAWGDPRTNRSVDGRPLTIAGQTYEHGLGTHADSLLRIDLDGKAVRFTSLVGLDDEIKASGQGSVIFRVIGDRKNLFNSGLIKAGTSAKAIDVDLTGVKKLLLLVEPGPDGMNYDHADWAMAELTYAGDRPTTVDSPTESPYILTPKPSREPRINGAKVFGVRPGSPILYTVAATGDRPIVFMAKNLPEGVSLDPETGQLSGVVNERGTYIIQLTAKNVLGKAGCDLKLVVGDTLALTPPMGWNSWNCWGCAVDADKIRESAKALKDSGLINHGWSYINIDDCWMIHPQSEDPVVGGKARDEQGMLLCNRKFPDMKGLTDSIHDLGLKAGIYISPGPTTCQNYEGSYQHEQLDALQFALWGFDYLKYDWCGYSRIEPRPDLAAMKKPYVLMKQCLDQVNRDIVYSLCQYGMGNVWEWGQEVGGNCWRTTGDITDTWSSMANIGFDQSKTSPYAKPGHWNDPDMLVVGKVGWGPSLRSSRLTPSEQYTHISLWCLLNAPLLLGCDLTQLDDFTLNLLTNDEVLAVNQDPLGHQAQCVSQQNLKEVWIKDLEDGLKVVGLFNRSEFEETATVTWKALGLEGPFKVRDLWRQKDLGTFGSEYKTPLPRHGVALISLKKAH